MALVVPEKGQARNVAKRLLQLADNPGQVATTADGPAGVSFVVPDDLYDRYIGADDAPTEAPAATTDESVVAPKRRGRPPGSKNKPKTETEE
jgi:hypothetical protein